MTNKKNANARERILLLVDLGAAAVMAVFSIVFLTQDRIGLAAAFGVASLGALFTAMLRTRKKVG